MILYQYINNSYTIKYEPFARITNTINEILNSNKDSNILVVTHTTAITSFLLNFCEKGYNLDERLILNYNGEVIVDGTTTGLDIFKLEFENANVINIEKL